MKKSLCGVQHHEKEETVDESHVEEYKGHIIKAKQVPESQSAFDVRFGWACKVYPSADVTPICIVVLKSLGGQCTESNIRQALELGLERVRALIDKEEFEKEYYCYRWEPGSSGPFGDVTEVDCDTMSPTPLRGPVR